MRISKGRTTGLDKLIKVFLKSDQEAGIFQRMAQENFRVYRKDYAIAVVCLLVIFLYIIDMECHHVMKNVCHLF